MITFSAVSKEGRRLVGLGISKANVKLLKYGEPIKLDLDGLGVKDVTFFMFYGQSDADVRDYLHARGFLTRTKEDDYVLTRRVWNPLFWWARCVAAVKRFSFRQLLKRITGVKP